MPYPFVLPTTSFVNFSTSFSSNTHPSLPVAASTARSRLRDALKRHKRMTGSTQAGNLPNVLVAIEAYLPYLFALDAGLGGGSVSDEEIDVVLLRDVEIEWRPTLTNAPLGRDPPRVKIPSLEADISFVLETMAYVQTLLAREALWPIYRLDSPPIDPETRAQTISKAMKHLVDACSMHRFLQVRATKGDALQNAPVDISTPVLEALASLALAEATLIAVLKDDPYPVAIAEDRNKTSREWMYKAPDLKASRLNLLVRLCMGAVEHASQATAILRNARNVDEDLVSYVDDLHSTAKAKAARFQAIALDTEGKTGESIAWIRAAKKQLGLHIDEGKSGGLSKIKRGWQERKEEKRIRKGGDAWGADGGKLEEGRVLEMLEKKWVKMNDTYSMHIIPPFESLLSTLPSGRDFHKPQQWIAPMLNEEALSRMRAPPDPSELSAYRDEDDSEEEYNSEHVGAFPGTGREYGSSTPYY